MSGRYALVFSFGMVHGYSRVPELPDADHISVASRGEVIGAMQAFVR